MPAWTRRRASVALFACNAFCSLAILHPPRSTSRTSPSPTHLRLFASSHLLPLFLALSRLLRRLRLALQTRVLWSGTRYVVVEEQLQGWAAEVRLEDELDRFAARGLWVALAAEVFARRKSGRIGGAGRKKRLSSALTSLAVLLLAVNTSWVLELG
ncbi:hypothetical protein JCM10207_008102 [Rhodosporidiobolus poonsookiae]